MSNGQRNDQKVLRERQVFHLKEAEKFLKIAGARVDGVSDTNRSRAQVHATLAAAYGAVHIDEEVPEYGTVRLRYGIPYRILRCGMLQQSCRVPFT